MKSHHRNPNWYFLWHEIKTPIKGKCIRVCPHSLKLFDKKVLDDVFA